MPLRMLTRLFSFSRDNLDSQVRPSRAAVSSRRPNRSRLQDGVDQRADGAAFLVAARIARKRLYAEIA